jgi:hypothetical protein
MPRTQPASAASLRFPEPGQRRCRFIRTGDHSRIFTLSLDHVGNISFAEPLLDPRPLSVKSRNINNPRELQGKVLSGTRLA